MKSLKQIIQAKGLQEKNKFDIIMEVEEDNIKEFKKRLKKATDAAGVSLKLITVHAKDDTIEINIPLNKLIGPATRKFCADRWNGFFETAGLQVEFYDNIEDAIEDLNVIIPMTFDRNSFAEIEE